MTEITNLQEEGPHNCNRNDENNKADWKITKKVNTTKQAKKLKLHK